MLYVRAIRKVPGVTAKALPLYLPPDSEDLRNGFEKEVFFGAVSMYLRERIKIFRKMPLFLEKIFDSTPLLRLAARLSGTTNSEGLEELTLNMIEGDNAFKPREVDRLVRYLKKEGEPDVIHLSNALILGLARQLKQRMNVKIVCSLLNEDDWIDDMAEPFRVRAWSLIAKETSYVDSFITPSKYSKDHFIKKTGVSGDNIHIVPLGFDPEISGSGREIPQTPSLGFFNRVSSHNGFDKLTDAFIEIRERDLVPGLTLHVCGGFTGVDKPFIAEQISKLKSKGLKQFVRIYPEFIGDKKAEFFRNVNVISVPVRKYDGYGFYLLEANAAGVPVVQPATGAFPEIIEMTGGGMIYKPDSHSALVDALVTLLNDQDLQEKYGNDGNRNVREQLSLSKMTGNLSAVYRSLEINI